MNPIDPMKLFKVLLISFLSGLPLVVWVFLSGTGRLGEFSDTPACRTVTIVLFIITTIWYVGVTPFLIWPRLFNGPGPESLDHILNSGTPARAVLVSIGFRGIGGIRRRRRRNTYQIMDLEVTGEAGTYSVPGHLDLVPECVLPFLRVGMEFPVRVSREDRTRIAIDWEPILEHYPGTASPRVVR